jgi:hypothetical protein
MAYRYRAPPEAGERRPSIEVRLPRLVGYLQQPFEQLIMKLDIAEERMIRIERKLNILMGEDSATEKAP